MNKIDPIIEADSLTRDELEIIRHYFSIPGGSLDWPLIQTSKGKVKGPIITRLVTNLEWARARLAASREENADLKAELDEAREAVRVIVLSESERGAETARRYNEALERMGASLNSNADTAKRLQVERDASRALVAEKDAALREWEESNHTSEVARIALALKEEEMME